MTPTNLAALPSNQTAPLGLCQVKRGQVDGAIQWGGQAAGTPLQDGNGNPMRITVTPQRRSWWVINAEGIFLNPSATWPSFVWSVRLAPADLSGWSGPDYNDMAVHSALGWQSSSLDTAYLLEAGVTYTATMCWESTTGNVAMQYWSGKDYFYIQGELIEDDTAMAPDPSFGSVYAAIHYTPTYPCFWVVKGNVPWSGSHNNSGGVWSRVDTQIQISPADADGRTGGAQIIHEVYDAATVPDVTISGSSMFRLNPGVAYTAGLWFVYKSGYFQNVTFLKNYGRVVGKIIGEGRATNLAVLPSNKPLPCGRVQIQRGGLTAYGAGTAPWEIQSDVNPP